MLDIPELEKQWSKYHFKKMLPRYIGAFITLSLIATGSFFAVKNKDDLFLLLDQTPKLEKKSVQAKTSIPITTSKKKIVDEVYVQNVLYPSYAFLEPLELAFINYNNAQKLALIASQKKKIKKKRKPKPKKQKTKKPVKKAIKPVVPTKKAALAQKVKQTKPIAIASATSSTMLIKADNNQVPIKKQPTQAIVKVGNKKTSEDEIRSIIKRFNRKKKPALSLFIARKYYEVGNFKGAYKYANETYKLNSKIEDATIIYAKSAVKLGKKETALSRLDKYIKKNASHKAKKLRNDIQKGTFQ